MREQETAKEVVQELFLKALEQKPQSEGIQGWLYRECRNRSIDILRKRKHVAPMSSEIEDKLMFTDADPLQELEASQEAQHLRREISSLPARQQEVLWLRYGDDLSYKEIAEVLSLTPSNVGFILSEAVRKLRDTSVETRQRASHE